MKHVFLTGITGLIGNAVARRLLRRDPQLRVYALVRNPAAWPQLAAAFGDAAGRVIPLAGDIDRVGLGLGAGGHRMLMQHVRMVIHCAADTTFSQPLEHARRVNRDGTAHVLSAARCWGVDRFVYVSTAFAAGARTGDIREIAHDDACGFVNAYEQSKHEAECLVRASEASWVILRPSTIVCDDVTGAITQLNAVHRALRVCHNGLAALMPGLEDAPVDLVTTDYVASAVADLSLGRAAVGGTYQLCAGAGALPLGELLDRAFAVWSRDAQWTRRGVARPALTDLATYRVFEQSVEETGDARLAAITRSLSHFVPQLALPKRFDTSAADTALGYAAPAVRTYWDAVAQRVVAARRGTPQRSAA